MRLRRSFVIFSIALCFATVVDAIPASSPATLQIDQPQTKSQVLSAARYDALSKLESGEKVRIEGNRIAFGEDLGGGFSIVGDDTIHVRVEGLFIRGNVDSVYLDYEGGVVVVAVEDVDALWARGQSKMRFFLVTIGVVFAASIIAQDADVDSIYFSLGAMLAIPVGIFVGSQVKTWHRKYP